MSNHVFIERGEKREEDKAPQFMKDAKSLWKTYSKTIVVGLVSGLAGALLCLLSTPPPRILKEVPIPVQNYSTLASWASSRETATLDLASDICPSGGRALQLTYNSSSNEFDLECEAPRLSRRAFVTLGVTVTALCLMISGSPPDICMLLATLVLVLWPWQDTGSGIITETEAWQGFSNKGVLTVGALFVVAKAVDATGVVSLVMKGILGEPKSVFFAQLRLLLPVAVASAFMNNTPIVAMLIPVVLQWAPRIGKSPSTFLMPLSFASMLGGMCSMMGTSTNLVVAGLLAKKNPEMKPFGLLDIAVVGGPCALVGILYMSIFSSYLLPDGESSTTANHAAEVESTAKTKNGYANMEEGTSLQEANSKVRKRNTCVPRSYIVYFVIDVSNTGHHNEKQEYEQLQSSWKSKKTKTAVDFGLAGKNMVQDGIFLEGILRSEHDSPDQGSFRPPIASISRSFFRPTNAEGWGTTPLFPGDTLVVRVLSSTLGALRMRLSRQGARLLSELPTIHHGLRLGRRRHTRFLAEAVVGRDCPLLGLRRNVDAIAETIMESYGAALVSIREDDNNDSGASEEYTTKQFTRERNDDRSSSGNHLEISLVNPINSTENSSTTEALMSSSSSITTGSLFSSSSSSSIRVGDVLLVEVFPRCVETMSSQGDFTLVTAVPGSKPPRTGTTMDTVRMYVAGLTLTAMILLSAFKVMSLLTAALCASAILLLFKTITLRAAFGAINGRTLLAIVTTFGVGTAFETTGLAHHIASMLIGVFGSFGSVGVLLSVAVVTSVVGCAVSNNAVVILMYPICATLARDFDGVNLRQLLVVLLVGASSSFLTPMSYQTNLMVFTPGKYQFSDYAKFGAGLQLSMLVCSVFMAWLTEDYWH
eukprot:g3828.t1